MFIVHVYGFGLLNVLPKHDNCAGRYLLSKHGYTVTV
jgi:hypothetical protein